MASSVLNASVFKTWKLYAVVHLITVKGEVSSCVIYGSEKFSTVCGTVAFAVLFFWFVCIQVITFTMTLFVAQFFVLS